MVESSQIVALEHDENDSVQSRAGEQYIDMRAVAIQMAQDTKEIAIQPEQSIPAVSYNENTVKLNTIIAMLMPHLKLDEKNQEEEAEIKNKLNDITHLFGEIQLIWLDVQKNLRQSAVDANNIRIKYQDFVDDPKGKVNWNEHQTKVQRDSLDEILKRAQPCITSCKESQRKIMEALNMIGTLLSKVAYQGNQELTTNAQSLFTKQNELQKVEGEIVELKKKRVVAETSARSIFAKKGEENARLFALREAKKLGQKKLAITQSQHEQIEKDLEDQEKALAEELETTQTDFKAGITQQRDIRKMFQENIVTARAKLQELSVELLQNLGSKDINQKQGCQTHYIFIIDESTSMKSLSDSITSFIGGDTTLWATVQQYLQEFLAKAEENLSPNDLVSCVGFSSAGRVYTRFQQKSPSLAKSVQKWTNAGGATYMAQALVQARQISNNSPEHRIMYVAMTDGELHDINDCMKECENIRNHDQKPTLEAPILFAVGLGKNVNGSQLVDLVTTVNGSTKYTFAGKFVCDLFMICEKTEEGVHRLQTLFKTVTKVNSQKVQAIRDEMEATNVYIKEQDNIKEKAMNTAQSSSEKLELSLQGIKDRYEEMFLKKLRDRCKSLFSEVEIKLKYHEQCDIDLTGQEAVIKSLEKDYAEAQQEVEDMDQSFKTTQDLKKSIQKQLHGIAEKNQKDLDEFNSKSNTDVTVQRLTKLKQSLDAHNLKLAESYGFYQVINDSLVKIMKGEQNMDDIVNTGIKTQEIRRHMIKKFLKNDKEAYQQVQLKSQVHDDRNIITDNAQPNKDKTEFKQLSLYFQKDFSEEDIDLFDNPLWVCAQFSMRLHAKDETLDILFSLFQACTFNEMMGNLKQTPVAKEEADLSQKIELKLKKYYQNNQAGMTTALMIGIQKQEDLKKAIKKAKEMVEELDEEIQDHLKTLKKITKTLGPARIKAEQTKFQKKIDSLNKDLVVMSENRNEVQQLSLNKQNKMTSKISELEDEEEIQELTAKLDEKIAQTQEKLGEIDEKIDEVHDNIVELETSKDALNNPEHFVEITLAKIQKQKEEKKEQEDMIISSKKAIKEMAVHCEEVQSNVDTVEIMIAGQLAQAPILIASIRDLGLQCFKEASESIYKDGLIQLKQQIDQVILGLTPFFNEQIFRNYTEKGSNDIGIPQITGGSTQSGPQKILSLKN